MLQQDEPGDYVAATGETHTVQEFCEAAFGHVDLDWQKYVVVDQRWVRPAEVELLLGDPTKAKTAMGWEPKVGFRELVEMMVDADMERIASAEPPSDFVIATGEGHTVGQFAQRAFDYVGLDFERYVVVDPHAASAQAARPTSEGHPGVPDPRGCRETDCGCAGIPTARGSGLRGPDRHRD
jgi:GDP-D-mannose dehydratase